MIKITGTQGALLGGLVLALAISAGANRFGIQDGPTAPPEVPSSPTPGWDLVYARPFTTDQPFVHWWRKERPLVDAGGCSFSRRTPPSSHRVRRRSRSSSWGARRQSASTRVMRMER